MPDYETRETWKNDSGTRVPQPLRQYEPASLEQVVESVKEADDYLVKPTSLTRVLDLETSLLNEGVDASTLIRFESGSTTRALRTNWTSVTRTSATSSPGVHTGGRSTA